MSQQLISDYNHDIWLGPGQNIFPASYEKSPPLGNKAPDFPLYLLTGGLTSLSEMWSAHLYTVVEFGSFT